MVRDIYAEGCYRKIELEFISKRGAKKVMDGSQLLVKRNFIGVEETYESFWTRHKYTNIFIPYAQAVAILRNRLWRNNPTEPVRDVTGRVRKYNTPFDIITNRKPSGQKSKYRSADGHRTKFYSEARKKTYLVYYHIDCENEVVNVKYSDQKPDDEDLQNMILEECFLKVKNPDFSFEPEEDEIAESINA